MRIGNFHISREQVALWGGVALLVYFFGPRLAQTIAKKTITTALDVAKGGVIGVGEAFGIPPTDAAKCAQNIRDGDSVQASFNCPPADFARSFHTDIYQEKTADGTHAVYDALGNFVGYSQ